MNLVLLQILTISCYLVGSRGSETFATSVRRPEVKQLVVRRPIYRRPVGYPYRFYNVPFSYPRVIANRRRTRIQRSNTNSGSRKPFSATWLGLFVTILYRMFDTPQSTTTEIIQTQPQITPTASTSLSSTATNPTLPTAATNEVGTSDGCNLWASWSDCKPEGMRLRARLCRGNPEVQPEACKPDCDHWKTWGECEHPGVRYRDRVCLGVTETRPGTCTPDCTLWSEWGDCSAEGEQTRERTCLGIPETDTQSCEPPCQEWDDWTVCSTATPIVVDATRTRQRVCGTETETEEEDCHDAATVGKTSDNWYRAGNGYEYYHVSSQMGQAAGVQACQNIDSDSSLAVVAAKNHNFLANLDFGAFGLGVSIAFYLAYHLGATYNAGTGTVTYFDNNQAHRSTISPWAMDNGFQHPFSQSCIIWLTFIIAVPGYSPGFATVSCTNSFSILCERAV